MSTTRLFIMPSGVIGMVGEDKSVQLTEPFFKYLGGLEDVSGRVADYVDPTTATAAQIVNALIAAKLMKAE